MCIRDRAQGAEKPVTATASGDASVKACVEVGVHCVQEGYRISDEVLAAMKEAGVSYVPCLVTSAGTDIAAEHLDVVRRAVKAGVQVALGTEMLPSQPMDCLLYTSDVYKRQGAAFPPGPQPDHRVGIDGQQHFGQFLKGASAARKRKRHHTR